MSHEQGSLDALVWNRSSFCGETSCVDTALVDGRILVRGQPLDEQAGVVSFDRDEWTAFVRGVRNGEMLYSAEKVDEVAVALGGLRVEVESSSAENYSI